ncbi:MAG: MFS transporter [Alphaproteobacteria bacterium]
MSYVDLSKKNDIKKHNLRPHFIWVTGALFYLYQMIIRVSPAVMTEELLKYFDIHATALGVLVSSYYYSYVPLQVVCGIVLDRFGTRIIITVSIFFCFLGAFLFSIATSLPLAYVGRFMSGAGSVAAFIGSTKIIVEWFPSSKFSFYASLTHTMGMLGGIVGGVPMALLVNTLSWQKAIMFSSFLGIIMMILSWVIIRDAPRKTTEPQEIYLWENLWFQFKKALKIPQVWVAGIVGGLMYIPVSAFTLLWAVPFLMRAYNIDNESAALANTMMYIGMAVGGPIIALIAEKIKDVVCIMRKCSFIGGLLFIFIAFADFFPMYLTFFILFVSGLIVSAQILCFAYATAFTPSEISATVIAFVNSIIMIGCIIFEPFLGLILDIFWDGSMSSEGVPIYDINIYRYSILTLPISSFASWLLLIWRKDEKVSC